MKALDSDRAITDPAWFTAAYAEGFRLYILASTDRGTCTPAARTRPQLQLALDAGLKVAAYTRNPACWQAGIEATGPYSSRLQFFALDIETGSPPLTRDMIPWVQGLGVRPVIKSGAAMRPPQMGATTEFSDVALWDTATGSSTIRAGPPTSSRPNRFRTAAGMARATCGSACSRSSSAP